MRDLSSQFNKFYNDHVLLPGSEKKRLRDLKKLNIERLKDGLNELNEEKGTDYKLIDWVEQGSVAMATVTKNERNDYDIDVSIIFDKDNLPIGTTATKNIIVEALKKKCKLFKKEPELKTNCVRIEYAEGYHIDFAIYRRFKDEYGEYKYEHCGSEWRPRDPRAITRWFKEENKSKQYKLSKVVRLMKMFCKSRKGWIMPGGLIQSVLANECFEYDDRIDIMFYNTLKAIGDRLEYNKEVENPADENQSLLLIKKDDTRIINLSNRLKEYLAKLDILFKDGCTEQQAIEAWNEIFNHSYWSGLITESASQLYKSANSGTCTYDETEEFIEHYFPEDIRYSIKLECEVTQDGFRTGLLTDFLRKKQWLKPQRTLSFYLAGNNVPPPYEIYWKVKNRGEEAERRNCIRGQIIKSNSHKHKETTLFRGEHYVECYIVKGGACVARDKIIVPINSY